MSQITSKKSSERNDRRKSFTRLTGANSDIETWFDHLKPATVIPGARSFKNDLHLLARAQFVVLGGKRVSTSVKDVDKFVDWEDVIQIRKYVSSPDICPICLCPPTLPQVIKCGHVFCFLCLRQLFSYFKSNWLPCPVCAHDIHKGDSRMVEYIGVHKFTIGDEIELKLLKRLKGSVLCHSASSIITNDFYPRLGDDNTEHCRIIVADDYSLIEEMIIQPFADQLSSQFYGDDIRFVSEGFEMLECLRRSARSSCDACVLDLRRDVDEDCAFFYQSVDGQNLFLDSFNVKCLLGDYAHLEKCPHVIKARIVAIESFIITEGLRFRWKFLSHLPLSSSCTFVEVNLDSHLSARSSFNNREEMMKRVHIRHAKEMREEKEMNKVRAEPIRINNIPLDIPDLSDELLFPSLPQSSPPERLIPCNRITYAQAVGNCNSDNSDSFLYEMCLSAKNSICLYICRKK